MGVPVSKERATFSIAADIKSRLEDEVPKSERSRFVEKAIDQALREVTVNRLKRMLDELPRNSNVKGESIADFLHAQRMKWDGRPLDVLEGKNDRR
ncbi:hypothetical protein RFM41_09495 [Mesorhizobium sp. VK25A]|uniref:Uncharacterized protein n=1 Tax=Mesorhizobium vachelliae TaxID=3072309 RepID=A0ABU5A1N4_9HYPH|nr:MULTISPECIES: hypothetical protein [unclassified Mesorhizobium]MDX8531586.1 hypothetical protein [Mesorhizobium sp. VK25D]MDX8543971.1 hypothetical protein [Mesorhizobium sp. VK25A]